MAKITCEACLRDLMEMGHYLKLSDVRVYHKPDGIVYASSDRTIIAEDFTFCSIKCLVDWAIK